MLNQKLRKFYSLLMPGKKTSSASDTKKPDAASTDNSSNDLKSARVLYRGDNKNDDSYEKATAAGNDWWIN